jgi:hypothetical protein
LPLPKVTYVWQTLSPSNPFKSSFKSSNSVISVASQ